MSKKLILVGAATAVFGSAAFANTQTFTAFNDYDHGILNPGVYLTSTGFLGVSSFSDTFNLTTDGFVPGVDVAVSGSAYFDITDYVNPGDKDRISVDLGSIDELSHGQVHDYTFSFNTAGGTSDLDILADINLDGELDYTVSATKGDFFLSDADLSVQAVVPVSGNGNGDARVPDGASTFGLLSFGLAGLTSLARKYSGAK